MMKVLSLLQMGMVGFLEEAEFQNRIGNPDAAQESLEAARILHRLYWFTKARTHEDVSVAS